MVQLIDTRQTVHQQAEHSYSSHAAYGHKDPWILAEVNHQTVSNI